MSSKPEQELVAALAEKTEVIPGYTIPDARLAGKHLIIVDAYLPQHRAVIEYDGAYWHRKRKRADERKARVLTRAGYSVIRLREEPLFLLSLSHSLFFQRPVNPQQIPEAVEAIWSDIIQGLPTKL